MVRSYLIENRICFDSDPGSGGAGGGQPDRFNPSEMRAREQRVQDNTITDAANLPEPDVLATEAMTELTEALREMNQLMIELGATDQAEGQVALLAEEFGLEKKMVEGAE